jgi:hypothetical protein
MSNCATEFCDKVYLPEAIKQLTDIEKATTKIAKKTKSKSLKLVNPKIYKTIRQGCILTHCNPGCKDTVMTTAKNTAAMRRFEKESLNAISSSSKEKKFISNTQKTMRNIMRKTIKAKYAQPLKNGFYKGLSSADVKMLKSRGATSGCSTMLPSHLLKKVNTVAKNTLKLVKKR